MSDKRCSSRQKILLIVAPCRKLLLLEQNLQCFIVDRDHSLDAASIFFEQYELTWRVHSTGSAIRVRFHVWIHVRDYVQHGGALGYRDSVLRYKSITKYLQVARLNRLVSSRSWLFRLSSSSRRVGENRVASRDRRRANLLVSSPPSSSSDHAAPSLAWPLSQIPFLFLCNLGPTMERVGRANNRDSSFSRSSLTASFVIGCHGKTGFRVTELYPPCLLIRFVLPCLASSSCLPS